MITSQKILNELLGKGALPHISRHHSDRAADALEKGKDGAARRHINKAWRAEKRMLDVAAKRKKAANEETDLGEAKEETEINELSKRLLSRYANKAFDTLDKTKKKRRDNRDSGIGLASDKVGGYGRAKVHATEEKNNG